jgi:hypothetical protein
LENKTKRFVFESIEAKSQFLFASSQQHSIFACITQPSIFCITRAQQTHLISHHFQLHFKAMEHSSPYLNTSECFTSSPIIKTCAAKEEQESKLTFPPIINQLIFLETSPEELQNGEGDDPSRSTVADFRIRIRKPVLSANDLATICHSFTVRNDVFRPKWFNHSRFDKTSRMIFARINCTNYFMVSRYTVIKNSLYILGERVQEHALHE